MISPLFLDLYPGDHRLDHVAFVAAGAPWHGVVFKASQGTRYSYLEWLTHNRNQLRDAAGERYGADMFDGMYHYLDLSVDGAAQADFFMRNVDGSGGERVGTLWAMVDVERGGQAIKDPSRAQVEDCTRAFTTRYTELTGRTATLYGGELLRSVGVRDRLGCGRSAVACYSSMLRGRNGGTAEFLAATGTDIEHTMLWQYVAADGAPSGPAGYPTSAPGIGRCDISTLLTPGGVEALRAGLWAERPVASTAQR
jgi:hypothetical protein